MTKSSNYFEEAVRLCSDTDPNVRCISESLYQKMLVESLDNSFLPQAGFSMLYFFQTVIRVWLSQRPTIHLDGSTAFPYECRPIQGTNWPESIQSAMAKDRMVGQFVELVKRDSVQSGEEFDVAYAVKILMLTFDGEGNVRNPVHAPRVESHADFQYWLAGFNSLDVARPDEKTGDST